MPLLGHLATDFSIWTPTFNSSAREGGIYGGQSVTGIGFSPGTSVLPCQYHATNASHSFIHLSLML
jgi:hypothetical protein